MSEYRGRVYAFILYEESMPENADEIVKSWFVPAAVSPVHDMDIDENGEFKKPHYHVMLKFSGKKSVEQVLKLTEQLGIKHVEPVNDPRAYLRYLVHMDEDDVRKARYDIDDVKSIAGYDLAPLYELTAKQEKELTEQVLSYIENCNVTEFDQLVMYAKNEQDSNWVKHIKSSSYFYTSIVNSKRNSGKYSNS